MVLSGGAQRRSLCTKEPTIFAFIVSHCTSAPRRPQLSNNPYRNCSKMTYSYIILLLKLLKCRLTNPNINDIKLGRDKVLKANVTKSMSQNDFTL